jgi:hypothetical protein
MYMKTKELGWKETEGIQNIDIENSQGNRIVVQRQETNDGRCTCEIKSRIPMEKDAFNKTRVLFTSRLDLKLRTKLVKCYIWSIDYMVLKLGRFVR